MQLKLRHCDRNQAPAQPAQTMSDIDKIDTQGNLHPAVALWVQSGTGLLARLQSHMAQVGAHPARTLVLLPYAQLLPLSQRLWAQYVPSGFAPRFETTQNWVTKRGGYATAPTDVTFDAALDNLTAHALLAQAGLGSQQATLAGRLVQAAQQLAPLVAAVGPRHRTAWASQARRSASLGLESPALGLEAALSGIAVEWAAVSGYASDALFDPQLQQELDCLALVQGLTDDPLILGLQKHWGAKAVVLPLLPASTNLELRPSAIALHACQDGEDEAQRSAACALQHIAAGRFPLAFVSSDRALTRRMRAMLEHAGVQIRDENGWKLSTSSAAAQVMALLRASVWNASTDAVLNWLKGANAFAAQADALEAALRRAQVRDWHHASGALATDDALIATIDAVDELRARFKGQRTLAQWLAQLSAALQACAMREVLQNDEAGAQVLAVLRLDSPGAAVWNSVLSQALWAQRRMDLAEFTAWVNHALENASFQSAYPAKEQVVFLPLSQMLGRPFAALVLAGCDEQRLNPAPEPTGDWTPVQRAALGLPTRDTLQVQLRKAWQAALQSPAVDVLWRTSDDTGETLLPSALAQLVQMELGSRALAADPLEKRTVQAAPVVLPRPVGQRLPLQKLSASAYEDLRQCPYRFFALRQLGLKEVEELDMDADKRDFGLWMHAVLKRFHEAISASHTTDRSARRAILERAAEETTQAIALPEGEFLPFAASWPKVREGYLTWAEEYETEHRATFASAETSHTQSIDTITLLGRIDRMDTLPDGSSMVLDYKTENLAKTRARVKEPLEDTQIAFYSALLPNDTLRAAYVNVSEQDGTKLVEQKQVLEARDALIEGIVKDMRSIAQGAPMQALGEGTACDFCQARGLCRKDFWKPA
jgi:ATP-dependent helicase/nuclease subunit B